MLIMFYMSVGFSWRKFKVLYVYQYWPQVSATITGLHIVDPSHVIKDCDSHTPSYILDLVDVNVCTSQHTIQTSIGRHTCFVQRNGLLYCVI